MKLTLEKKNEIREALIAYCAKYRSQNQAAQTLQGVSPAIVSQIANSKYETIGDDMFMKICMQIGFSFDDWQIDCGNRNFRIATSVFKDAQIYKHVYWLTGAAGCGKTTTAIQYKKDYENVYYVLCSEDMRRSDFIRAIGKVVGTPVDYNLHDALENALTMVARLNNPLLIFDEADKLSDPVLTYFISIYNRVVDRCGIVLMSTDYIKRRVENGRRYKKKGYEEIYSRIGRRFVDLDPTTQNDIHAICTTNGLTAENDIKNILQEAEVCENDLRRVKRVLHARKLAQQTGE